MTFTFNFNSSYSIEENNGTYTLHRLYEDRTVYFNLPDYSKVDPSQKEWVTSGIKRSIERELKERDEQLYSIIFEGGSKPVQGSFSPSPKTSSVDVQSVLEVIQAGFKELSKNPYEQAITEAIISKSKDLSAEQLYADMKDRLDQVIKEEYGSLPQRIEVKTDQKVKVVQGIFHTQYPKIVNVVSRNIPVMLVGEAGTGKNHTLEQVAEALELDFYMSNAITQEYKLTGFIDANGRFHETEFYKAFTNGGLFFLDEIDASIPDALLILNSAIANRYFDFPTGRVTAHENFRVVSAGNTFGRGADEIYTGRSQLDGATIDRFVQIPFTYDPQVESQLASSEELYQFIVALRESIKKSSIRFIVSMRATINASQLEGVLTKEELITMAILKGLPKDEMKLIVKDLPNENSYVATLKSMVS